MLLRSILAINKGSMGIRFILSSKSRLDGEMVVRNDYDLELLAREYGILFDPRIEPRWDIHHRWLLRRCPVRFSGQPHDSHEQW